MLEARYGGNLFLLDTDDNTAMAVTTNGMRTKDGKAVMGAGIARYARDSFPGIDTLLGQLLAKYGNHAYFLGSFQDPNRTKAGKAPSVFVLSFPTKQDWRGRSSLELIRQSAREAMGVADRNNLRRIWLPAPGCANGGLDYISQVRPVVAKILDDRFTVCLQPDIYDRLA